MDKKNFISQTTQPVLGTNQGTQVDLLAELSEENMGSITGGSTSVRNNVVTIDFKIPNGLAQLVGLDDSNKVTVQFKIPEFKIPMIC